MWSTVTVTLFFSPQSFTQGSNHLSYAGTKWLHWRIFRVLRPEPEPEALQAVRIVGRLLALSARSPPALTKSRRVTVRESGPGPGGSAPEEVALGLFICPNPLQPNASPCRP